MQARESAQGLDATGVSHAVIAYGIWGFAPIYWKVTASFPAPELLAWRMLASLAVAWLLVASAGVFADVGRVLRSPRAVAAVGLSCLLLSANWLTFIYAVQTDRILSTSLGYFINPLMSVLLGLAVLRERLSRAQSLAVCIAAAGVACQTWLHGELPWISLVLASAFGLYGLVRKLASATPLTGFGLETLGMAPFALGFLWLLWQRGDAVMPEADTGMRWLVAGSGLLTAGPLVAFASAAKRLPLYALGMFQFVAPTLSFLLAVVFYGEAFTLGHMISFGCVWLALALFSWDAMQRPGLAVVAADPVQMYPPELERSPEEP
jgi:chloramphenicol-sensitive protein RarD